ncbi:MAG: hypothetical protein RQ748_12015, partial [Elusimicrobiales bacterium]|nr:hypothetical protein [Elusimicrobiales bacterium]
GTTIIFKVYDSSGATAGGLKLPSGYSNYRGEIAAYRIARFLGITIFPPTVPKSLASGTAARLAAILKTKEFRTDRADHHKRAIETKEENRRAALRTLSGEAAVEGCFKEWVENIQFVSMIGTRDKLARHPVMTYLKADGPLPPEGGITLKQCTSLMTEKGCFSGEIEWSRLARDISDMMLVDALSGNLDRFPGGNVHMRSLDEAGKKVKGGVHYPRVELLALDNGATFMGPSPKNLRDLTGRSVPALRVERFAAGRHAKLRGMKSLLDENPAAAREKFFLRTFEDASGRVIDMLEQLAENVDAALAYMDRNAREHGPRAVLP